MVLDGEDDGADDDGGEGGLGDEGAVGHQERQCQEDQGGRDESP